MSRILNLVVAAGMSVVWFSYACTALSAPGGDPRPSLQRTARASGWLALAGGVVFALTAVHYLRKPK